MAIARCWRISSKGYVHAMNTSQEPVKKTEKSEHEPFYNPPFECPRCGHYCREWVGLTDEEKGWCAAPTYAETIERIEAKLKEKNT